MRYGLFRGKEVNSNEWVYGYYTQLYGASSIVKEADNQGNFLLGVYSLFDSDAVDASDLVVEYNVDTNTVGAWTGLTDVNDIKIFEGDIVDLVDDGQEIAPERGVVEWDAEYSQFVVVLCEDVSDMLGGFDWKVVGNIFDNPGLIEESEP